MAWALPRAANQFWMLSEPERAAIFLHNIRARMSAPSSRSTLDGLSATFAMNAANNYLQLFAILSLPIMLVMLMADISLGLASRFATSLNVFSMSQPVKAVVALAMLTSMHPRMMAGYLQFFAKIEEIFL